MPVVMPWSEAVDAFLLSLNSVREPRTIEHYADHLSRLAAWAVARHIALADFRVRHMERFRDERAVVVSKCTLRKDCLCARVFTRWLTRRYGKDLWRTDPLRELELPRAEPSIVTVPTPLALASLFKAIRHKHELETNPHNPLRPAERTFLKHRDLALYALLIQTGLRSSECCALTRDDYAVRDDIPVVIVRHSKTHRSRIIPLSRETCALLDRWLRHRPTVEADWLFISNRGEALQRNLIHKNLTRYLTYAGLAHYSVHSLRHAAASAYVNSPQAGVAVARDILGHANIATTNRYSHTTLQQMAAAVNAREALIPEEERLEVKPKNKARRPKII